MMNKNRRSVLFGAICVASLFTIIIVYLRKIVKIFNLNGNSNQIAQNEHISNSFNSSDNELMPMKLGAKRTAIQLNNFLPQIHLTLISVLQGLVLGILISRFELNVIENVSNKYGFSFLLDILMYFDSLLTVVLVWYLYSSVFVIFVWPLSFWHTSLQFFLTVVQSFTFIFISTPGYWTMGVAAMTFVAAIIRFLNTKIVKSKGYERKDIYRLDMKYELSAFKYFTLVSLIFVIVGFMQTQYNSDLLNFIVAIVILLLIIVIGFYTSRTNTNLINKYFENSQWTYENNIAYERSID